MPTIINLQHHPLTRQHRAAEAASLQATRLGLPSRAVHDAAADTIARIRTGTSAAMAIYLAIRIQRARYANRPSA